MKKLISILLTAAMLLSLAACTSTAADAAADDPEAETASTDASAETPPEKPDGTPPDGANGQPGTPPDGNPPDGAPNGQPGGFGGGRRLLRHERRAAGDERRDRHDQNATVNSFAQNGNGVFSYGADTTVSISDSTITTSADNSGGIQTTGGGTTNAENLTVTTSGNSSAAIRSDRGGGTVNVTGGSYTSNGYNSPAVYSTAAITVKNAKLTANNSELLVIEGKNSIALENCTVSGNMSSAKGSSSSENVHTVMIYQSMSGDADVGTSEFSMTGGSLIGKNGDLFYITNTHCILTLSGVTLKNEDPDGYLLRVVGNFASHGWGAAGSNGAQVEFTADAQTLEGNILVDTISTLDLTLQNGSSFTGTINIVDNAEGGASVSDNAVVTIGSGCTWTLTGDCTITSLINNGKINFSGHTITLADGTVLRG